MHHPAFIDLFNAIKDRLDDIKDHPALEKAAADGVLGILEFWDAVRGSHLAPVYDQLRHASRTALNPHFPASLREKGLADMKSIVASTLADLTKPPEAEVTAEEPAAETKAE